MGSVFRPIFRNYLANYWIFTVGRTSALGLSHFVYFWSPG